MSLLQVLYFFLAALVMTLAGWLLLVTSIRSGDFSKLYTGMIVAFAAKMFLGLIAVTAALKLFGWQVKITVIGIGIAYLIALFITTASAMWSVKRVRE